MSCVCGHQRSKHWRDNKYCLVAYCPMECNEFLAAAKNYRVQHGHRLNGMKGKIFSLSQLQKRGNVPPYGEEV